MKKVTKIYCPRCGAQYLPGEVFLPKAFLGQPKNVVKDFAGQILDFDGKSMDLNETYQCDKCDGRFRITAKVQFLTSLEDVGPYKIQLKDKNKIVLDEK